MSDEILFEFLSEDEGRLDSLIAAKSTDFSRSSLALAIKNSLVKIDDKIISKPSTKVKSGQKITLFKPNSRICDENNDKNALNSRIYDFSNNELFAKTKVLYEDNDVLVLSKPSGLVVHEASSLKEPTLVDFLKASKKELATLCGEQRAGIVHRLDRLTSGAMMVAKSQMAAVKLSEQLKNKTANRLYLAITDLALKENCVINRALARCESNRLKKAVYPPTHAGAKSAKSAFCNIYLENSKANLIGAKLFSGRTHQIRAHLASINRHILGDILYGFKGSCDILARIFLHAFILEFIHPITEQKLQFIAPLPDDFLELLGEKKDTINEKLSQILLHSFDNCDEWLCYA